METTKGLRATTKLVAHVLSGMMKMLTCFSYDHLQLEMGERHSPVFLNRVSIPKPVRLHWGIFWPVKVPTSYVF